MCVYGMAAAEVFCWTLGEDELKSNRTGLSSSLPTSQFPAGDADGPSDKLCYD